MHVFQKPFRDAKQRTSASSVLFYPAPAVDVNKLVGRCAVCVLLTGLAIRRDDEYGENDIITVL
jgi:hypothetical protein